MDTRDPRGLRHHQPAADHHPGRHRHHRQPGRRLAGHLLPRDSGGACTAPYVAASGSGYCTLPQNVNATLTYSSSAGTYTYTPTPGTSYTYSGSTGALMSETDTAGDTLTVTGGSPSPGSGNCPSTASSLHDDHRRLRPRARPGLQRQRPGHLRHRPARPDAGPTPTTRPASSPRPPTRWATSPPTPTAPASTGNPQLASDLLTITSPNAQPGGPDAGDATVNVYDASGRVTSQTDPMGYQTTFNYCVNAAAGDCMNPATGTGIVTVTDPDGNTTVYSYQQGTLAARVQPFTGSTADLGDRRRSRNTARSAAPCWTPASTDGDGNTTTNTYNAAGNPTPDDRPGRDRHRHHDHRIHDQPAATTNCDSATSAAASATCQADAPPGTGRPGRGDHPAVLGPAAGRDLHPVRHRRKRAVHDHRRLRAGQRPAPPTRGPPTSCSRATPSPLERHHRLLHGDPAVAVAAVREDQRRRGGHPARLRLGRAT